MDAPQVGEHWRATNGWGKTGADLGSGAGTVAPVPASVELTVEGVHDGATTGVGGDEDAVVFSFEEPSILIDENYAKVPGVIRRSFSVGLSLLDGNFEKVS